MIRFAVYNLRESFSNQKMEFIDYENIPGKYTWIVDESPEGVESVLKKGVTLENEVKAEDWSRSEGTERHWHYFNALRENRLRVNGRIRDFDEWSQMWDERKQEKIEAELERRHQQRVARARRIAIENVRRLRPNQPDVHVIIEQSPSRIEELDTTPEPSSDEERNTWENLIEAHAPRSPHHPECCPANTDCQDQECTLQHF